MADLDTAIQRFQESVDQTPSDHPECPRRLWNLGAGYSDRYRRTGDTADLDTAIQHFQEAVEQTPSGHPERAGCLQGLGAGHHNRYRRTGDTADLDTAIQHFQEAVDQTPSDHPERVGRLQSLGAGYYDRYQQTGSTIDLETAIQQFPESVNHHPDRAAWLDNLGIGLGDGYSRTRAMADLEEAIQFEVKDEDQESVSASDTPSVGHEGVSRRGVHEELPETIDGVATSEDVSFTENGSISDRGESSLGGTTLVELQARATKAEQSVIAEHEKEGIDYMSIVSNDEDIASQALRRKTEPELLAVKLFGAFFAELDDLRPLHEDLLKKLGTARFIVNYRRSLKVYVLKLREEAQTALEKDTVKIIENQENRRSMALQIVEYMGQEDVDKRKQFNDLALQPLKKQLLEDWAYNTYGPPDLAPVVAEFSGEESEGEGNEDLETNPLKTLTSTNLDKACNFLQKDTPLQTLILQLRLLALPPSLREIMETTPKHTIRISEDNNTSLMNKCKTFVEICTTSQWDWWPLRHRVPDLTPGQLRLEWDFCGETLYAEISPQEVTSIKQILIAMSEHPPECHCCKVRLVQLDWTTAFQHIYQTFWRTLPTKIASLSSTGTIPPSKANLRYTPTRTTSASSSSHLPHGTPPSSPQSNLPNSNVGTQAHIGVASNNTPVDSLWVVFGIKDMRGFHNIENIETDTQFNDPPFFQELKLRHRNHRWCFQHWFSPYRFQYCRFVQFEELLNEHVSCIGEALPDEHGYTTDYEYNPRPPGATIPLIDPVRFSILLSACNPLCYWSLLPAYLHKCRHIPVDRRFLTRIPRKKGAYNAPSCVRNFNTTDRIAFGIEAGYSLSFAFLFLYHVALILSGFSFWIYWMKHHPADLQNASVPLFTVIMLIGTFWKLFGKQMHAS